MYEKGETERRGGEEEAMVIQTGCLSFDLQRGPLAVKQEECERLRHV